MEDPFNGVGGVRTCETITQTRQEVYFLLQAHVAPSRKFRLKDAALTPHVKRHSAVAACRH